MKFKEKQLIIFDLDGTLINSIPDLTNALNKTLKHFNLSSLTVEEVTPFIGNGARTLVERALKYVIKDKEISKNLLNEATKIYFSAYEKVTCEQTFLYPFVLETLSYLKQKDYKMAICTNKPYSFIEPILNKLSLKQYFEIWIGEDSLSLKKPSGAPLLHLAKMLNTDVEKCIMVGDSKNDIFAAQNSEMDSIGVNYGYNYNESISDYNPTLVVENFFDLKDVF